MKPDFLTAGLRRPDSQLICCLRAQHPEHTATFHAGIPPNYLRAAMRLTSNYFIRLNGLFDLLHGAVSPAAASVIAACSARQRLR